MNKWINDNQRGKKTDSKEEFKEPRITIHYKWFMQKSSYFLFLNSVLYIFLFHFFFKILHKFFDFWINYEHTIGGVTIVVIIIFVVLFCFIKIGKWHNLCNNRIGICAFFSKF